MAESWRGGIKTAIIPVIFAHFRSISVEILDDLSYLVFFLLLLVFFTSRIFDTSFHRNMTFTLSISLF